MDFFGFPWISLASNRDLSTSYDPPPGRIRLFFLRLAPEAALAARAIMSMARRGCGMGTATSRFCACNAPQVEFLFCSVKQKARLMLPEVAEMVNQTAAASGSDRSQCPGRSRCASDHGQLRYAQDQTHPGLAGQATALACPLHTDRGVLDQPSRTIFRPAHRKANQAGRPCFCLRPRTRHPSLYRGSQRRPASVQVDKSADDILGSVKRFCVRSLEVRELQIGETSDSGH